MLGPRRSRWRLAAAVSGALLWLGCGAAAAQSISPAGAAGAGDVAVPVVSGSPADYHPSMGDLMTMAVQPRHIKLGLAGEQRNWAYAAYELSELRNAFGRTSRAVPVYNGADSAALIAQYIKAPLDALEQAIRAGSSARFRQDSRVLTRGCNACHISQNHAAVVIQVPDARAFPDQRFATQAPLYSGREPRD